MKRMKVLFGNRRMMVLLTLAILVLAATALVASSASFTATSANPNNSFTAGTMSMSNTRANAAILTAVNMWPGKDYQGTVTIGNVGAGDAAFVLKLGPVTDPVTGTLGARLSDALRLSVVDETGLEVYNGALNVFPASGRSCGDYPAGQEHTYTFTVTFPDSDAGFGTAGSDNKYKLCQTIAEFDWEAVSK